jgi:plasmid stabilization system protein ParE
MGTPVVLAKSALRDLESIVRYISLDNPERARSFGNLLIDRALAIGTFPEIGRIVPEKHDPELREVIFGAYRIVYRVKKNPNGIYVLRFWHAARGAPEVSAGDQ